MYKPCRQAAPLRTLRGFVRNSEANESRETADFNHALSGKSLTFSVEVVELRAASEEELSHGHAHGPGGHHH